MKNSNYRAIVIENNCFGSGDCIKICKVNAIVEGPKRIPMMCGAVELLPGKAFINSEICNGCGECISVCPNQALELVAV
ncbi:MAG: 4Fe-4S binding protein [Bacteroidota bacterium]|nr:MAG: 4Fe-4S binding protein [Bacteroidota bacterium]